MPNHKRRLQLHPPDWVWDPLELYAYAHHVSVNQAAVDILISVLGGEAAQQKRKTASQDGLGCPGSKNPLRGA